MEEFVPNINHHEHTDHKVSSSELMNLVIVNDKNKSTLDCIETLIKNKSTINYQNSEGYSALMLSCKYLNTFEDIFVIKMLINAGADVNMCNIYGNTALMHACFSSKGDNNLCVIKMLIDAGADVNLVRNPYTALMIASQLNLPKITQTLIDSNAEINYQNNIGRTSLILACQRCQKDNNYSLVKMLIDSRADVNLQTPNGETALMLTIKCNGTVNLQTIKLLIDSGSDVNLQNDYGYTALMSIMPKIENSLIHSNKYHQDDPRYLEITEFVKSHVELIELLLSFGANVNFKTYSNKTFLMLLLSSNGIDERYVDVLHSLIHVSKETLSDTDTNNKTAYDYYVENNCDILDTYHLELLKGNIRLNNTKSARH